MTRTQDRPRDPGAAAGMTSPSVAPAPAVPAAPAPAAPLTRAQFFDGGRTFPSRPVTCEGFGTVLLASLTQDQYRLIQGRHEQRNEGTDANAPHDPLLRRRYINETVAAALVNPDGTRMFNDPIGEGAAEVGRLPLQVAVTLFDEACRVSAITKEAREEVGKPSSGTPPAAASSSSASSG